MTNFDGGDKSQLEAEELIQELSRGCESGEKQSYIPMNIVLQNLDLLDK